MKKIITIALAGILLLINLTGCVSGTNVCFRTDVDGAEVYVDDEFIGTTPVTKKMSNLCWKNPDVTIKKEGYKTLYTEMKKEIVYANVAIGFFLWEPAFLWCYGPKPRQNYILVKNTTIVEE